MASSSARKLAYLKERIVNAYWMVKKGEVKLIFISVWTELKHRVEQLITWFHNRNELDDSQVPGSAYVNRRKVLPPSYRPTQSRLQTPPPLQVDAQAVSTELSDILSTFKLGKK